MNSIPNLVLVMTSAGVMGLLIGCVYKLSHSRAIFSYGMFQSLMLYSVLTAMMLYLRITVSTAVLIGAVSILRFRNPIKDHRDLIFILWSIVAGFCCATHMFPLLGIGSVLVIGSMIILRANKQYERVHLAVKSADKDDESIIQCLNELHLTEKLKMLENNSDSDVSTELIYEVRDDSSSFETAQYIKEMIYKYIQGVTEVIVMYQEDDTAI